MSNVCVAGWWGRVNFCTLTNDTKLESRGGRLSEPGNIPDLTGQGSEQPDQTLELALVWAGVEPDDLQRPLRTYWIPWLYIQDLCKKYMLYTHNKSFYFLCWGMSNFMVGTELHTYLHLLKLCSYVSRCVRHTYSIACMCRIFSSSNHSNFVPYRSNEPREMPLILHPSRWPRFRNGMLKQYF